MRLSLIRLILSISETYQCLAGWYSVSASIKSRIPCFLFLSALLLPCSDDPTRAPLRFNTMILNATVTAGTGAAAYLANGVGNDARAGVGVSYEGR